MLDEFNLSDRILRLVDQTKDQKIRNELLEIAARIEVNLEVVHNDRMQKSEAAITAVLAMNSGVKLLNLKEIEFQGKHWTRERLSHLVKSQYWTGGYIDALEVLGLTEAEN